MFTEKDLFMQSRNVTCARGSISSLDQSPSKRYSRGQDVFLSSEAYNDSLLEHKIKLRKD